MEDNAAEISARPWKILYIKRLASYNAQGI